MESGDRAHDHSNERKVSQEEITELWETIITGLNIMCDAAGANGTPPDKAFRGAHERMLEDLGDLCRRARRGNSEAVRVLRSIAADCISKAGSLDCY